MQCIWISFGAVYTRGNSDQRNALALASDSVTRRIQGDFSKLSYKLGWLSKLPQSWSLNANLRGQLAGDNLDSSEQFSLGGVNGIRAYPTGEGSGDEGWLASLNLGKKFSDTLSAHLFYDAGSIRQHHDTWANWNASNPGLSNTYSLKGAGAGLDWRISPAVLLSASVAKPIGDNPGANAEDHNVDGERNKTRAWLKLSAEF